MSVESIVNSATQTTWESDVRFPVQVSRLFVTYAVTTKQGRKIVCQAMAQTMINDRDWHLNADRDALLREKQECLPLILREFLSSQLGHRVGLKGHRGRFFIAQMHPYDGNGHARS